MGYSYSIGWQLVAGAINMIHVMGLVLIAFLILLIVNGLAHTFLPQWAVRQSWSVLNERRLRYQAELFGMVHEPSNLRIRFTGVVMIFAASMLISQLSSRDGASPFFVAASFFWTILIGVLCVLQGGVWFFSPRWITCRFPSMNSPFPPSTTGRIVTRILGFLMLAAGVAIFLRLFAGT